MSRPRTPGGRPPVARGGPGGAGVFDSDSRGGPRTAIGTHGVTDSASGDAGGDHAVDAGPGGPGGDAAADRLAGGGPRIAIGTCTFADSVPGNVRGDGVDDDHSGGGGPGEARGVDVDALHFAGRGTGTWIHYAGDGDVDVDGSAEALDAHLSGLSGDLEGLHVTDSDGGWGARKPLGGSIRRAAGCGGGARDVVVGVAGGRGIG